MPAAAAASRPTAPNLGLVCITIGPEVRYRTTTRTRFLALDDSAKRALLEDIYQNNVRTLFAALEYCAAHAFRLYRVTSNLFPQVDHPIGAAVRDGMSSQMSGFAARAKKLGVRVVMHPDQWVVLNSESPRVVEQSVAIMQDHARTFDLLGLPQSPWSMLLVHGGKRGRPDQLVETIARLPENVGARLALENDESCYSATEILDLARRAGVPMVFDAHHHVVREGLKTYEHPSVAAMTRAARTTWRPPGWQVVHISNGCRSFADCRHSELIGKFPSAFHAVRWVEVEAKGKENAIGPLRRRLDRGNRAGKTGRP